MPLPSRYLALAVALLAGSLPALAQSAAAYPSETPAHFQPTYTGFDYGRRDVMIPMRDGVKLHTVILVPNGAQGMPPSCLTRTPYGRKRSSPPHAVSCTPGTLALRATTTPPTSLSTDGYIRVVQDVRGKYGSEGDFVMNRPLHGPQNPTLGGRTPPIPTTPSTGW